MLTSYSAGSFAEYATIEGWFSKGGIYAEGKNCHDNSEGESKASGNHIDDLTRFLTATKTASKKFISS